MYLQLSTTKRDEIGNAHATSQRIVCVSEIDQRDGAWVELPREWTADDHHGQVTGLRGPQSMNLGGALIIDAYDPRLTYTLWQFAAAYGLPYNEAAHASH